MAEQSAISEVIMRGKTNGISKSVIELAPAYKCYTRDYGHNKTITCQANAVKGQKFILFVCKTNFVNQLSYSLNATSNLTLLNIENNSDVCVRLFEATDDGPVSAYVYVLNNVQATFFEVDDDCAGNIGGYYHGGSNPVTLNSPKKKAYLLTGANAISRYYPDTVSYVQPYITAFTNASQATGYLCKMYFKDTLTTSVNVDLGHANVLIV